MRGGRRGGVWIKKTALYSKRDRDQVIAQPVRDDLGRVKLVFQTSAIHITTCQWLQCRGSYFEIIAFRLPITLLMFHWSGTSAKLHEREI